MENRKVFNKEVIIMFMKIAILNECFFTDEHIKRLKKLGEVTIYDDTDTEEKTVQRLKNIDVAIGDQFIAKFNKNVLGKSSIKHLALNTTSFGYVDIESASKQKIKVSNTPGFSKQSVAELVIGLMFSVNRKIALGDRLMRNKPLELDPGNKNDQRFIGFEIKGKTLGVLGLGNIGSIVAELGIALGMNVVGFNRTPKKIKGVKLMKLNELLKISDVISINLPLNSETKNMITAKEFNLMQKNAILINTSQPEIVNSEALSGALKSGKISGAGLDVGMMINFESPLFKLENVVFTPHLGSFTEEAFFKNLPDMIVANVEAFVKGKPINLVN